ncbi:MAG: hypothetical protein V2A77_04650 [Pseudomonadota bacterium]
MRQISEQRERMPWQRLSIGAYAGVLGIPTGMTEGGLYLGEGLEASAQVLRQGGKAVTRSYQKHSRMPWRLLDIGLYVVALGVAAAVVGIAAAVFFIREKAEAVASARLGGEAGRKQQAPGPAGTVSGAPHVDAAAGAGKVTHTRVRVFSRRVTATLKAEEAGEKTGNGGSVEGAR